jgi:hypothetical protein
MESKSMILHCSVLDKQAYTGWRLQLGKRAADAEKCVGFCGYLELR